jgi:hypothetical protein
VVEGYSKLIGQKDVKMKGRAKQVKVKAQNLGGHVQETCDRALGDDRDKCRDK